MSTTHTLPAVTENEAGTRLDKFLTAHLAELSRSRIQALIAEGRLKHQGTTIELAKYAVQAGEVYELNVPAPVKLDLTPAKIPLEIVYEDEHLLVINKQPGLAMHPGPGQRDGTLVHALLHHCGNNLSSINGVERPGIVHRLDKDTSGLVVVAKDDISHQSLSSQFSARTIDRHYLALCFGIPNPASGTIEAPIGRSPRNRQKQAVVETGRPAVTHYEVLKRFATDAALVKCVLETGRTHQIRVHMTELGHSLMGDPTYGRIKRLKNYDDAVNKQIRALKRQMLHAAEIGFEHPVTGQNLNFSSPPPSDFLAIEKLLSI